MGRATHVSETPATAWMRRHGVAFGEHVYDYVEHGGTAVSSQALGVPEHDIVKTLVMQDELSKPLIVLMHGDRKVSTKSLARQIAQVLFVITLGLNLVALTVTKKYRERYE